VVAMMITGRVFSPDITEGPRD